MSEGNNNNVVAEPKKLKRPVEEIRAELLASPDVQEQARLVKLPVEQYVEKIIDYATHPEKPPQIQVTPDDVLKARDPKAPTVEEIHAHLEKIVSGEVVISPAHQRDGFSEDRTKERFQNALGTADTMQGKRAEAPGSAPASGVTIKKDSTIKP